MELSLVILLELKVLKKVKVNTKYPIFSQHSFSDIRFEQKKNTRETGVFSNYKIYYMTRKIQYCTDLQLMPLLLLFQLHFR